MSRAKLAGEEWLIFVNFWPFVRSEVSSRVEGFFAHKEAGGVNLNYALHLLGAVGMCK